MGYCMEQMENNFCIKKENAENALNALKELARKNKNFFSGEICLRSVLLPTIKYSKSIINYRTHAVLY